MSPSLSRNRPENELLLCCARTQVDSHKAQQIKSLLQQDLDWVYLIQAATQHGMLPLLCWHLRNVHLELVPQDMHGYLQRYSHHLTQHNFLLTRELLKILGLLEEKNIAVAPLKGPVLAVSAYGNLALRQFADLDILVHKRDVSRARDTLLCNGYYMETTLTQAQEAAHLRDDSVYEMRREDGKVSVELHWAVTSNCIPFPLDFDRLRKDMTPTGLAGATVSTVSPEDTLLILCMHGTKHIWSRLGWICDVAELIRAHPNMDWKRVATLAHNMNNSLVLHLGLLLAHDVLEAKVPNPVWQEAKADRRARTLATRVSSNLFREENSSQVADDFFLLQTMERLRDRIRYFLHLATTPSAEERALIPGSLAPLWWLIRPVRLVGKYVARFFGVRPSRPSGKLPGKA